MSFYNPFIGQVHSYPHTGEQFAKAAPGTISNSKIPLVQVPRGGTKARSIVFIGRHQLRLTTGGRALSNPDFHLGRGCDCNIFDWAERINSVFSLDSNYFQSLGRTFAYFITELISLNVFLYLFRVEGKDLKYGFRCVKVMH